MAILNYVLENDAGQRYIEVPVHPMTRRYIFSTLHNRAGYVNVRLDDWIGCSLALVTQKESYRRITVRRKSRSTKVKIVLPQDLKFGKIEDDDLLKLGLQLDKSVKDKFHLFVFGAVRTGCSDNFAVVQYLETFGICEDDYSLDTAKKSWRYFKQNLRI